MLNYMNAGKITRFPRAVKIARAEDRGEDKKVCVEVRKMYKAARNRKP